MYRLPTGAPASMTASYITGGCARRCGRPGVTIIIVTDVSGAQWRRYRRERRRRARATPSVVFIVNFDDLGAPAMAFHDAPVSEAFQ